MMTREGIMTIINNYSNMFYTELTWETLGIDNIENKKRTLSSEIWNDFVKEKYAFIKILYFQSYDLYTCSKAVSAYSKILKNPSTPEIIKNAPRISKEINFILNQRYSVYAMEAILSATEDSLLYSCDILDDQENLCLVMLSNSDDFIAHECWGDIYNILEKCYYLDENNMRILMNKIDKNDALIRTFGFFDDEEIGFSVFLAGPTK